MRWTTKIITPILALVLVSACGTTNNNNDDTINPETNTPENINAPGDNNTPRDKAPTNDNIQDDNRDMETPYNDVNNNRNDQTQRNNNGSDGVPNKMGTHNISDDFDNTDNK